MTDRQAPERICVNAHLFVYGTLMPTAGSDYGRHARQRLVREASLIGAATMPGRLYDLGRYPGVVERADAGQIVHGELLRLADPVPTLAWLDRYENIVPGGYAATNEYGRVERPVMLAGEVGPVDAWVYIYQWSVTGGVLVPDGRWRAQR